MLRYARVSVASSCPEQVYLRGRKNCRRRTRTSACFPRLGDIPDAFGLLRQGHIDEVIVAMKNEEGKPLERFVFALRMMVEV